MTHRERTDDPADITPVTTASSSDGSSKTVWRLQDGNLVESVSFTLGDPDSPDAAVATPVENSRGHVVCISSQAGCNVACTFCATGLQRMKHDLSAQEMVAQVRRTRELEGRTGTSVLTRVIFAGMGEPLLNLDAVLEAITLLEADPEVSHVSLSTMGVLPALDRLTDETTSVDLFLSLHATTDELRARLIPLNKANPIASILGAAERFARTHGRLVDVSYLLFKGVNESDADAARLIELLDPRYFRVQLLLWNEVEGMPFERVDDDAVVRFRERLVAGGLPTYIMPSKARDIDGGCGQMITEEAMERRRLRSSQALLDVLPSGS